MLGMLPSVWWEGDCPGTEVDTLELGHRYHNNNINNRREKEANTRNVTNMMKRWKVNLTFIKISADFISLAHFCSQNHNKSSNFTNKLSMSTSWSGSSQCVMAGLMKEHGTGSLHLAQFLSDSSPALTALVSTDEQAAWDILTYFWNTTCTGLSLSPS